VSVQSYSSHRQVVSQGQIQSEDRRRPPSSACTESRMDDVFVARRPLHTTRLLQTPTLMRSLTVFPKLVPQDRHLASLRPVGRPCEALTNRGHGVVVQPAPVQVTSVQDFSARSYCSQSRYISQVK